MASSAEVIRHGVLLDGRTCYAVWQVLRTVARLPPAVAEAKEAMRLAAGGYYAATSGAGPTPRTSTDASSGLTVTGKHQTASEIAAHLRCTDRHVRRIAQAYQVPPVSTQPFRWDADGARLIAAHISSNRGDRS